MSTQHTKDGRTEPELTRRKLLTTTGAAAGAVAVGAGGPAIERASADNVCPLISDDEKCETAGKVALFAASPAIGAGAITFDAIFSNDLDPAEAIGKAQEQANFNLATSIKGARAGIRGTIRDNHISRKTGNSSFSDTAWSAAKQEAAEMYKKSDNPTKAKNQAKREIDKRFVVAVNNAVQRWNRFIAGGQNHDSLIKALVSSQTMGAGQFSADGNALPGDVVSKSPSKISSVVGGSEIKASEKLDGLDTANGVGKYSCAKVEWSGTPYPLGDIADLDKIEIFGILYKDNSDFRMFAPNGGIASLPTGSGNENLKLTVNAPNANKTTILDGSLYHNYLASLKADYVQAKNDIGIYIDNAIVPAVDSGNLEDVLSGVELVENFEGASDSTRLAANMLAAGYQPPAEIGQRVKVSHGDLSIDRWGDLYVRWSGGSRTVSEGDAIKSSNYDSAVLGYQDTQKDPLSGGGSYQVTSLSGDKTLKILKIEDGDSIELDNGRPIDKPDDPSKANPDDVRASNDRIAELIAALEAEQDGSGPLFGGGGLFGGDGIPDWAVLGGIGVLGLGILNALSG